MGREGRLDRGRTGQKGRTAALVRLCWLKGVIEEKRAFYRGSTGLHGRAVVLGRMDWAEGLKTRFSVLCVVMMGRIDWLRDVGTGLGKDVLAIALEIWMIFDGKRRMASMDWAKGGERNGWEGYGGRKEGKSGFGKDKLGRICVQVFVEVISRV